MYLEREYLWGPGDRGVDELLVQFDRTAARKPWWVIQDDGGDVVAVCDTIATGSSAGKGRVVQQLTYDAYGEALTSSTLQPHPVLRCGHKGLFVDRLDVGVMSNGFVEYERIVLFSYTLCYNRNRTYSPMAGRFLQADPNETGQVVAGFLVTMGMAVDAIAGRVDLRSHYADGMSAYTYLRASPAWRSDVLGLYDDAEDDDYDGDDLLEDVSDILGLLDPLPAPSDLITGMYRALLEDYSENLDFDVEWASNWDLADDDHSRTDNSWIPLALNRGLYEAFDINLPFSDKKMNPLDLFAGKKKNIFKRTKNVSNGHTLSVRKGQSAHKGYPEACGKLGMGPPDWRFEQTIPGVGQVDGINRTKRIVRELKPDTPFGRARGQKQLIKYVHKLEKKFDDPIGSWTGVLDFYRPYR